MQDIGREEQDLGGKMRVVGGGGEKNGSKVRGQRLLGAVF